jgi:recombination associated protein RdgC
MFEVKNTQIFKAVLPQSTEQLARHLEELPYGEIPSTQFHRDSFIQNTITGELVTPFTGGYSFIMRRDEKVIPPSTLKEEVNKAVASLEAEYSRKATRKERSDIKEEVLVTLLPRAFTKPKFITCLYLTGSNYLIVDTSSAVMASAVVRNLVKVCGSVKTTTIHVSDIKNGLATRLKRYITESEFDVFGSGLSVGSEIKLSKPSTGEVIQYSGVDPITDSQLEENLEEGFIVDHVRFTYRDDLVQFTLNKQFRLGSMSWASINHEEDTQDAAFEWRHEAAIQAHIIGNIVDALCKALDYQEPKDEQKDPEQKPEQTTAGENKAGSKTPVNTGDPLADYWSNSASASVQNTPPKVVDLDPSEGGAQ